MYCRKCLGSLLMITLGSIALNSIRYFFLFYKSTNKNTNELIIRFKKISLLSVHFRYFRILVFLKIQITTI